jgi:TPR repeat protein
MSLCKDYAHPSSLSKKAVDAIIDGCSTLIGISPYGPKVVEAFLVRGAAYRLNHEYAKATQDLNRALSSYGSDKVVGTAARLLGTMSLLGEFSTGNAMSWFLRAADKGDSIAMAEVASLYAEGQLILKNCDRAREWVQKAIAAGYEKAKVELRSGFGGKCQW